MRFGEVNSNGPVTVKRVTVKIACFISVEVPESGDYNENVREAMTRIVSSNGIVRQSNLAGSIKDIEPILPIQE